MIWGESACICYLLLQLEADCALHFNQIKVFLLFNSNNKIYLVAVLGIKNLDFYCFFFFFFGHKMGFTKQSEISEVTIRTWPHKHKTTNAWCISSFWHVKAFGKPQVHSCRRAFCVTYGKEITAPILEMGSSVFPALCYQCQAAGRVGAVRRASQQSTDTTAGHAPSQCRWQGWLASRALSM